MALAALVMLALAPARALEIGALEIVTKNGVHSFTVEIAQNDDERATGLMNRRSLPETGLLADSIEK